MRPERALDALNGHLPAANWQRPGVPGRPRACGVEHLAPRVADVG